MTVNIDMPPEVELQLVARAQSEGLSVDAYVRRLLVREGLVLPTSEEQEGKRTAAVKQQSAFRSLPRKTSLGRA